MDVDFTDARGSFAFASKGKPGHEGTAGNLKMAVKMEVSTTPEFIDKYLDGHLSGAQPTSVLWRLSNPEDPSSDALPRYMGMKKIELEVSSDRRYAFKIRTPPPEGWAGKEREFPGYREVTLLPVQIKKVVVSPAPNALMTQITFTAENQRPELSAALSELVVLEEVAVDGWLVDRDLPLGEPKDPPRGGGDDDEDPEGEDRDDTGLDDDLGAALGDEAPE